MTVQHTLHLWPRGLYPRRVVYYLLIKGLAKPSDLLQGRTTVPTLSINIINYNKETQRLESVDVDDPRPAGKSTPCMRVVDSDTGRTCWIHESTAIPAYLEDAYSDLPPLQSQSIVERAIMGDIILAINAAQDDFSYYLRHASPVAAKHMALDDADRSRTSALNAKAHMNRCLSKVQKWAEESLGQSGWLTPGIETPGLADVCLAGWLRYIELAYELNVLEGDGLDALRSWWARFKTLPWWEEMEETGEIHPEDLRFGKENREI